LHLLRDSPKALNLYEKSIKHKNAAWVSGTAFVGFAAYIAGSTEIKNEDFGDLNTTQKLITAGFVGTAAVFATSLFFT